MALWERAWDDDGQQPRPTPSTSGRYGDTAAADAVYVARPSDVQHRAQQILSQLVSSASGTTTPHGGVPTLRSTCLAYLGRNVTELVAQVGPHLGPLPADIKACLLCVARRRGVLTNRVLLALADEGWGLLDLAGAAALSERAIRQALLRCPRLRALDLRGLPGPGPALLRQLPALCPALQLLAVGGCRQQEEAALEVLPDILPHVRLREQAGAQVQDSWEEALAGGGVSLPDPGEACGLVRLALLVWPGAPPGVAHTLRTVSPTVTLLEELPGVGADSSGSGNSWSGSSSMYCSCSYGGSSGCGNGGGASARACHCGGAGVAVRSTPCGGSRRIGSSSGGGADWSLQGACASDRAAASQPGIRVLHARSAGAAEPAGDLQRGRLGSASSASGAGSRQAGGGSGAGRYTAPHLRQQQQQHNRPAQEAQQDQGQHGMRPPHVHAQQQYHQQQLQQQPQPQPQAPHQPPLPNSPLHGQSKSHRVGRTRGSPGSAAGPTAAVPPPQLDDVLAAAVAEGAWRGLGDGGPRDEALAWASLHIAEKFRLAYEQQDARLRAKARREAAAEARRELRASGAAREVDRWLNAE